MLWECETINGRLGNGKMIASFAPELLDRKVIFEVRDNVVMGKWIIGQLKCGFCTSEVIDSATLGVAKKNPKNLQTLNWDILSLR